MGKQTLDKKGQPILTEKTCRHGIHCDDRGNTACEECLVLGRTNSYLLGIAVGWEEMAEKFKVRSGEEYAKRNDDKAKFYRDLASDATKIAEEKRHDWKNHEHEHGLRVR